MSIPDEVTFKQRSSLVDEAYVAIRASIIEGRIPPGARVTIRPIADQLSLSSTPIKAALVRLEREGILVSHLHRGYFVPELSCEDMGEIYELREALDCMAGRRAAMAERHSQIATILAANCEQQRERMQRGDLDGYREKDIEFHQGLWALCGNQRLRRTAEGLMDQMRLGNSVSARLPGRVESSLTEHVAIVEAIAQGDADAAERATRQHVQSARTTFLSSSTVASGPGPRQSRSLLM